mgnify:CR=1 FL=1
MSGGLEGLWPQGWSAASTGRPLVGDRLVIGAVIAVPWGTPNADGLGVSLSIISTLAIAGKTSLSALLMKDAKKDGLTPIVLVWYDSIFSICVLVIAQLLMGEWFKISQFTSHEPVITVIAAQFVVALPTDQAVITAIAV